MHHLIPQLASTSAMFVEGLHKSYFAKTLFRQLSAILVRSTISCIYDTPFCVTIVSIGKIAGKFVQVEFGLYSVFLTEERW